MVSEAARPLTVPPEVLDQVIDRSGDEAVIEAFQPIVRKLPKEFLGSPGGLNLNLLMFFTSVTILIMSGVGHFVWHWPGPYTFLGNVLALHIVGTVIHDACHKVAHKNRIVNAMIGHGCALMLGFAFPVFTRVHLEHHAHVNDPDNDPDHFVSTAGPLWMLAVRFLYHEVYFFQRRLWRKYELLEWFLSRLAVALLIIASCQYGFLKYVLNFWFCPALVVGIILGLVFDYFPHRPFLDRSRWGNARVGPSRLLNILVTGHNYHLVHHLWPSMPWYRYKPAYELMQPLLDQKNCKQSYGLLESKRDFLGVVYDIFLGVNVHHHGDEVNPRT